jgi:hypothetical protein
MEEIRTRERLDAFIQQGGYIFNCFYPFAQRFTTFGTLHTTDCPYLAGMSTKNNPKFYFSSIKEAEAWLDDNAGHYDNKPWKKCGVCL